MSKIDVIIGHKIQKSNLVLPKEVSDILLELKQPLRKAYYSRLIRAGWTYQGVANALGVSRQAIEIGVRSLRNHEKLEELMSAVSHLPVPEVPRIEIRRLIPKEPTSTEIDTLKALHDKARQVRNDSPLYREEAEEFTRLAWEVTQSGVSTYTLAKKLGLTHSALFFRFVRYGYSTTKTGKSKTYQTIKPENRKVKP